MEKLLMTREEFKKFDEKIQEKIKVHDAATVIEAEYAPMSIAVSGAESVRAYWAVSGKTKQGVYSFALLLRDGYVWELESTLPNWTTSGNQKQLTKVLRDFYNGLSRAFYSSDMSLDVVSVGQTNTQIHEAITRTVAKVKE